MSRPWYRRFPDNFISGTVGLTLEEKGAYSLVLDMMYVRSGPIQDEPRYIAGVCNCSVRKWNTIRARLIELDKLYVINGFLFNERAEKEIEIALKDAQERAENGSKGGNKSAENRTHINKNKNLGQASVQLARATQYQHQLKKEGNSVFEGEGEAELSQSILVLAQDHPDYAIALAFVGQTCVGKTGNITIMAADLEQARLAA